MSVVQYIRREGSMYMPIYIRKPNVNIISSSVVRKLLPIINNMKLQLKFDMGFNLNYKPFFLAYSFVPITISLKNDPPNIEIKILNGMLTSDGMFKYDSDIDGYSLVGIWVLHPSS